MASKLSPKASALPEPAAGRTNDDWLADLQRTDPRGQAAHADLRDYVRGGLGRALGGTSGVDDQALEDFTQEAVIRILARLDSFRGDSRFTTWAMAIAIRIAYSSMRRKHWGDRSLDDLGLAVDERAATGAGSADPTAPAEHRDLLEALRDVIDRALTPRQRAAIMGELAGMPVPVLAEQLGTNPNALHKLHHDARLKLRSALEQRGFDAAEVRNALDRASEG